MAPTAVTIMAKVPQAGAVKTRLCPPLEPQEAARLYDAFLRDKITQVRQLHGAQPTIAYTPDDSADFFTTLAPDFVCIPQRGADLGERLINAFAACLATGCAGALAIDSDTPTLPAAFLQQAIADVTNPDIDLVLGPSDDGGYYLIGLRTVYPELFVQMPWSTAAVREETLQRAAALGLKVALLPTWFDIDTYEDLQRLQAMLVHTEGDAPRHTRQFFRERGSCRTSQKCPGKR